MAQWRRSLVIFGCFNNLIDHPLVYTSSVLWGQCIWAYDERNKCWNLAPDASAQWGSAPTCVKAPLDQYDFIALHFTADDCLVWNSVVGMANQASKFCIVSLWFHNRAPFFAISHRLPWHQWDMHANSEVRGCAASIVGLRWWVKRRKRTISFLLFQLRELSKWCIINKRTLHHWLMLQYLPQKLSACDCPSGYCHGSCLHLTHTYSFDWSVSLQHSNHPLWKHG